MDSADTESTLMQHLILQSTESFGTQQLRLDGTDATYLPMLSEDATQTGLEVIRASAQLGAEFNAIWDDGKSG